MLLIIDVLLDVDVLCAHNLRSTLLRQSISSPIFFPDSTTYRRTWNWWLDTADSIWYATSLMHASQQTGPANDTLSNKNKEEFHSPCSQQNSWKSPGNSCSISSSGKSIYLLDVFIQQIPLLNVASYFNVTRPSPYKLWNNSTLKLEPEMIGTKWQSLLVWNPKSEDKSRPQTEGSNSPPY